MRVSRNKQYDKSFKDMAVQKTLSPGAPGLSKVASSLGIASSTLYGWTQAYANVGVMKKTEFQIVSKKDWSAEMKLQAIINKCTMTEHEYGEFLRSNGLHSSDVEDFKAEYFSFSKDLGRKNQDPEVAILRKENRDLQSDLNRKDKALAEMSARIVLLKKSHLLWGDPEGES